MKDTKPYFAFLFLIFSVQLLIAQNAEPVLAKFEPPDGECLFFVGDNLESIGGLEEYTEGYCDYFDMPTGVSVTTSIMPGTYIGIGGVFKGNDGLETKINWGAGDYCAQSYLEDSDFQYSIISIGLIMAGYEKMIADGHYDDLIRDLGEWIKGAERPVFLRIGYEFDAVQFLKYERKYFLRAWKRIYSIFEEMAIDNVAYVWQSKGYGSNQRTLEKWYPGDEYVDWCAYSYYGNPDHEMLDFARKHNKPVIIADATPVIQDGDLYFKSDLKDPLNAERVWHQWFVPFFETLNDNKDVIKAFSYTNSNWSSYTIWQLYPQFKNVDSRIQMSDFVSENWKKEIEKLHYLKPDAELWDQLNNGRSSKTDG